jgi:cell division initiation protein
MDSAGPAGIMIGLGGSSSSAGQPMNITPLDITQKQFRKALRGYEREEVEGFLSLVAVEFEALVKEVNALREDNQRKVEELAEHKGRERTLQETLVTAQKASEDIRESARKEAEITISDAELQAEKIVQGAHARFLRIVDDINELKRQRVQFESTVRMLVESHLKLIEAFQEPARDESVQFIPGARKKAAEE